MCPARRRDAVENAKRIIEAAAEVFSEHGLDAPVPMIAARANVGKATVYRNFASKADLVAAIAHARLETIGKQVDRACANDSAWDGFTQLLEDILILQAGDRSLGDSLRHETRKDVLAARREIIRRSEKLLERARAEGMARHDASAQDMRVFLSGAASELTRSGVTDLAEWRRYSRLIADVFRAKPAN